MAGSATASGTAHHRTNVNLILSTAPLNVLQAAGDVDADGNITAAGLRLAS